MSMDLEEFYEIFFEECFENLELMETGLMNLDLGAADAEGINTIFRAAHSIKGGSATFDFNDIAAFTHIMETLLDEMRDGRRQVTRPAVDLLLESTDCLSEMIKATQAEEAVDQENVQNMQQRLQVMLSGIDENRSDKTGDESDNKTNGTGTISNEDNEEAVESADVSGWSINFQPHINLLQTGNEPSRLFRELAELGQLTIQTKLSNLPAWSDLDPEECHLSWQLQLAGEVTEQQILTIFEWIDDDCEIEIKPLAVVHRPVESDVEPNVKQETAQTLTQPVSDTGNTTDPVKKEPVTDNAGSDNTAPSVKKPSAKATGKPAAKGAKQEHGSIRVSIDKVDELINLVGELVITQSMLSCFASDFDMSQVDNLRDGLNQLARTTRELQETSMQIRMLPISSSFNRFPRLVRDLGSKMDKLVELRLSGENTELDKTVLEKIGDPLVHLVRNSLDHGLETPEVRKAAGKSETGILCLNAFHEGGNIVIEVIDDGAGLNKDRILSKALERGLVSADDKLSDDQIYNLIFQAGFSTAEVVSDLSGRGVGMDVVRRNINDLGGTVHIKSETGKGSTLTIRLPLTLAILDGQLVRVGKETYIISLVSIMESLQVKPGQVSAIAGKAELYKLRDEYIPIIRLHDVFNIKPDSTEITEGLLVVAEADGQRVGIFVDDLMGQQQVVIKSLETNYEQVQGLSGATILGNGTVGLILDVPGLIQRYLQHRSTLSKAA